MPEPAALASGDLGEAVTVAYVHSNDVAYSWHKSMTEMIGWDISNHGRIMAGGFIAMRCGTNGLVQARNMAVQNFLEDKRADWLWWVDTDMGFAPDTIDRLLEAADPIDRPIVGALCFSMREYENDGLGGWRTAPTPTVFDWANIDGQMGFAIRYDYKPNVLTQAAGTGSACVLIHRSVFEKVADQFGPTWYDRVPNTSAGQLVGEDLSFCMRVNAAQIPLFIHTGVRTTHMKTAWIGDEDYWRQQVFAPARVEEEAAVAP